MVRLICWHWPRPPWRTANIPWPGRCGSWRVAGLATRGIAPVAARDFTNQPGKGVQATIGGRRLVVGNAALLAEFDVAAA